MNNNNYTFAEQLSEYNLTPLQYLDIAKYIAEKRGYDPERLTLSTDNKHKLEYDCIRFGAVGYKDKIIYSWLEHNNELPEGTAIKKGTNYRKRAERVMLRTNNKFSPASLAWSIIW